MRRLLNGTSLVLMLAVSIALLSCSNDNQARRGGQTTIRGKVAVESAGARGGLEGRAPILVVLKSLMGLIESANAQSTESILVIAFQNGAEVDRDTTDTQGDFEITVPRGGDVTLRFQTPTFTATTLITVTPESEVTLDVSLLTSVDPPEVRINAFQIVSGPIRTREAEEFVFDEADSDLTIDGGGGDCIKATGGSEVDIRVSDLTLTDCEHGINGEDFANVILEAVAVPTLSIDARNSGIHAEDDSSIRLMGTDIFITAGVDGILATGTSGVEVNPSGDCVIQGGDDAVDKRDLSSIDTAGCTLTRGTSIR